MEFIKEVSVQLVRRYKQVRGICPICGDEFLGSPLKRYCSSKCSKLACWRKNGESYRANRRTKLTAGGAE
jgi:hypothetical protein